VFVAFTAVSVTKVQLVLSNERFTT
jgi:hypothetical protein